MTALAPRTPSHPGPARPGAQSAGTAPVGPAGRRPAPERPPGRRSPPSERLQRLAAGFSQAFLEVECGRRPRAQLRPLLCPRLAVRLAEVWVRQGVPGRVVRTYGCRVAPDRYEAVAVVQRGQRFGALAVALARTGGGWRVVDAARPEDGVLPGRPKRPTAPDETSVHSMAAEPPAR